MIWASVLIWIAAFVMWIAGGVILIRTGMADFEPWEQAKRRLILSALLATVPGYVMAFHLFPIPLAIIFSFVVTALLVLNFVMVVPKKWRRVVRKRE